MVRTLRVLDPTGDTSYEWDTENPSSVAVADEVFTRKRSEGYIPYAMDTPTSGRIVQTLDREAPETILSPPMVGG